MDPNMSKYFALLSTTKLSVNQKMRKLSSVFRKVGGRDSAPEAYALIMGRKPEYCDQQKDLAQDVYDSMTTKIEFSIKHLGFTRTDYFNFLVDCKVIVFSIRILEVQLFFRHIYQDGLAMFLDEDSNNKICVTECACQKIVFLLIEQLSPTNALKDQFSDLNIVYSLISCLEDESSSPFALFSLRILHLMLIRFKHKRFFERYLMDYDIVKLCRFLGQNMLLGRLRSWVKKGLTAYEMDTMVTFIKEQPYLAVETEQRKEFDSKENTLKHTLDKWILTAFNICFHIIEDLNELSNDVMVCDNRILLTKDDSCLAYLTWWCKTPLYHEDDLRCCIYCMKILAYILKDNRTLARKLMQQYEFEKCIEIGIRNANNDLALFSMICVDHLIVADNKFRHHLVNNQVITQRLIKSCFSPVHSLKTASLVTLTKLISDDTISKITNAGFGMKKLFLLTLYYPDLFYLDTVTEMKSKLWKYFPRSTCGNDNFDVDEEEMRNTVYKAHSSKDKGNDYYKNGSYVSAVKCYTEGLKLCCPDNDCNDRDINLAQMIIKIWALQKFDWLLFLSKLHSNRAQCYLQLNQYSDAIEDCDYAMILCNKDTSENKALSVKSSMRRAICYFKLGKLTEALMDIGYCMMKQPKNKEIRVHFDTIFNKYYTNVGTDDLIRRCMSCFCREVERFKRCAKCKLRYCSRKCQLHAWENGHDRACQNYLP